MRSDCGGGPPLADVAFESFAQGQIARLDELRLAAQEARIGARLSAGDRRLVVAELEQLVAEHPSRERLLGLLMLTLYRCGRQTDALEVYARAARLDAELGLDLRRECGGSKRRSCGKILRSRRAPTSRFRRHHVQLSSDLGRDADRGTGRGAGHGSPRSSSGRAPTDGRSP